MTISSHLTTFAGLPIHDYAAQVAPDDPAAVAWRVDVDPYGDDDVSFDAAFAAMLERAGEGGPVALVIGGWGEAFEEPPPIELLTGHAARMPRLRSLFLGEMTFEQCEISWITQADVTPLLTAFPELERLWIRGSQGLELKPLRHEALRELAIESGGLPGEVTRAVAACDFPRLTHLELWLGVDNYGGDTTVEDLAPVLGGRAFPALTSLGLRNAENADELAAALAAAPVVARLERLDLSNGTLGDAGGEALLTGQPLSHLRELNLAHHFLSPQIAQRLVEDLPGVAVDVSDVQKEEEWGRYTAVAE